MEKGLSVKLTGKRAQGAYIKMTVQMMRQFGVLVNWEGDCCKIPHKADFGIEEYQIEPDVSGACYFYAMAPLLKTSVIVKDVHGDSIQGDIKFLNVLEDMGCGLIEQAEGIMVDGRQLDSYPGLTVSMKDFSDQTMTLAALAPFATSPTVIKQVGHIRMQESDRLNAILTELGRMGISCKEVPKEDGIMIWPGTVEETKVETYEDHRMAMAFTLVGLKTGVIIIKNPGCCKKTFENYFQIIDEIISRNREHKQ